MYLETPETLIINIKNPICPFLAPLSEKRNLNFQSPVSRREKEIIPNVLNFREETERRYVLCSDQSLWFTIGIRAR